MGSYVSRLILAGCLMVPCLLFGQVTIECIVNETVTAGECNDCTNITDSVFVKFGLRCINGSDTTILEGPVRIKARGSSGDVVMFDYRANPPQGSTQSFFFNVSAAAQFGDIQDVFAYVRDCASFLVDYGDSTKRVHWGDTMFVTYPEATIAPGDTTYYWIIMANGADPDTITMSEVVDFVQSGEVTITKNPTTIVFHVPNMRDSFNLYALPDSSNRLILARNGIPQDTVDFFGIGLFNDSYADSAGVWNDDTVMVYRRDTSGIIDSFPIVIPASSINTDDQQVTNFNFNTGTRVLTLEIENDGQPPHTVTIPDDAGTDDQQLSLVTDGLIDTIFLENGGFVVLHDSVGVGQPDTYLDSVRHITDGLIDSIWFYRDSTGHLVDSFLVVLHDSTGTNTNDTYLSATWCSGDTLFAERSDTSGIIDTLIVAGIPCSRDTCEILIEPITYPSAFGYEHVTGLRYTYCGVVDSVCFVNSIRYIPYYHGEDTLYFLTEEIVDCDSATYGIYPIYIDPGNDIRVDTTWFVDDTLYQQRVDTSGIIDTIITEILTKDFDFILLDGDTMVTLVDTLIPRDSADLHKLIWHGGRVRLGLPAYEHSIYLDTATGDYLNFVLHQDSVDTGLQIFGRRSALDIYHHTRPYQHFRNQFGEFWQRIFDPTAEGPLEPQRWEFGAVGKYEGDTTSRPIFTIDNDADAFSLNITPGYLQSDIYASDRSIDVGNIHGIFAADSSGQFVLMQVDSVGDINIINPPQTLTIDSTTAIWTLSDDPTPDLMPLPWKDSQADDFSANYTDSIRHEGLVGIRTAPKFPLDIRVDLALNRLEGIRIQQKQGGVAAIMYEDSSSANKGWWRQGMISNAFLLQQKDASIGSGGRIVMEVDSGASQRSLRLIGPGEGFGVQMQDYGLGNYLSDEVLYITAWGNSGKLLEISFPQLVDSLVPFLPDTSVWVETVDTVSTDKTRIRASTVGFPAPTAFFNIEDKALWLDNGFSGQANYFFGDYASWSSLHGSASYSAANNFHYWGNTNNISNPLRVEFESNASPMQFYIEGKGEAWYGWQDTSAHKWSYGYDTDVGGTKLLWSPTFGLGSHVAALSTTGIFSSNFVGVGTEAPGTGLTYDTKVHLLGSGSSFAGRTALAIENTTANSGAIVALKNSAGNSATLQLSGPSYSGPLGAVFSTVGVPLKFITNGDVASGGADAIRFAPGGFSNDFMTLLPTNLAGLGITTPETTLDLLGLATFRNSNATNSNSQLFVGYGNSPRVSGSNTRTMVHAVSNTNSTIGLDMRSFRHLGTEGSETDWTSTTAVHTLLGANIWRNGSFVNSSLIRMADDGAHGVTNASGNITFWTSDATSGFGERMRIDPDGEVGIMTTNPLQTLHVQGTARITGSSGTITGLIGRNAAGDIAGVGLSGLSISSGTLTWTMPTISLTGNVTGSGTTSIATTIASGVVTGAHIADNSIGEADLFVSNAPTSGFVLAANTGTGGFTWVAPGTVTSVAAGNGMNFSTITTTGSVTLGTPGTITLATTNSVSTNSHTHEFALGGTSAQYLRGDGVLATLPTGGSDGDGIYDGSGTIPNSAVVAQLGGASSTFSIFDDGGTSIWTATASGSGALSVNVDGTYGAAGADQVKLGGTAGSHALVAHEDMFGAGWGVVLGDAGAVEVRGNASTILTAGAASSLALTSSALTVDVDAIIGGNSADQFKISTTSAAAFIMHESFPPASATSSYIAFVDNGDLFLRATSGSDDKISLVSNDYILLQDNGQSLYVFESTGNMNIGNGSTTGGTNEYITFTSSTIGFNVSGTTILGLGSAYAETGTGIELHVGHGSKIGAAGDELEVTGDAYKTVGGVEWNTTSDRRIKQDIEYIDGKQALKIVSQLRPASYQYTDYWAEKNGVEGEKRFYSYIAQDIEEILPEAVYRGRQLLPGDSDPIRILESDAISAHEKAALIQLIRDNEQQAAQISVLTEQINKLYDLINKK